MWPHHHHHGGMCLQLLLLLVLLVLVLLLLVMIPASPRKMTLMLTLMMRGFPEECLGLHHLSPHGQEVMLLGTQHGRNTLWDEWEQL